MASDAVVNLIVNAADADRDVDIQLRRIVSDAERTAPDISLTVNVDQDSVVRQVRRLETALSDSLGNIGQDIRDGLGDISSILSAQLDESNQRLAGLDDRLDELTRTLAQVGDSANNNLGDLNQNLRQGDDESNRLGASLRSLGSVLGGIGRAGLSIGAIGVAAGGAVPVVAGLATSLANIAPAAAAGVTAFVGLKFATATLKAALIGVDEAISAVFDPDADPAALAEAMARLAPEAQSFVKELQRMKPALEDLRLDVQNELFRGLDTQLRTLSSAVMPDVSRNARNMATVFNQAARGIVQAGQQLAREGSLGKALDSSTTAFGNLSRVPGQVLLAIGRLAAAGGPLLIRFSESIASAFDGLSERMEAAIDSGALEDAVNGAGDALAQLGRIAGNIGETLGNVFSAAQVSGDGLFTSLESITQAMADVTASTAFQDALGALIEVASELTTAVLPILMEAFNALLPVIEILAPPIQELIRVLGEELLTLIPELQPVLIEMAGAFAAIIEAVIPLIPPLLDIIENILPLLIFFFRGVAEIVEGVLAPALEVLVGGLAILVEAFNNMAGDTLRDYVIPIIETFVALLRGDMTTAQQAAAGVTRRLVDSQIEAFTGFARRIQTFAVEFVANLTRGADNAARGMISRVQEMISQVGRYLGQLPSIAARQLAGMGRQLYASGAAMVRGFIDGMLSQISGIRSAANSLVSAARDYFPFSPAKKGPFSGKGYTIHSGRKLVEDFGKGIQQRRDALQKIISSVLGGSTSILTPEMAFAGPRTTAFGTLTSNALERTSPTVLVDVRVGNEQLNPFIDTRIAGNDEARDRTAAQGTRF